MKRSKTDKGNKAVSGTPGKAVASTIAAILCLFLFGAAGAELPRLYNEYTDKQILNRPEYTQNSVETYSYTYASMADKLEDIARYQAGGGLLGEASVPLTEDDTVPDDTLLGYVDEELKKLYECGVLPSLLTVADKSGLESKELIMLYPFEAGKISGAMQFWSLDGITVVDEYSQCYLSVLMDAQFHSFIFLNVDSMYDSAYGFEWKYWEVWSLFEEEGWDPSVEGMYYLGNNLAEGLGSYYGISYEPLEEEESSEESTENLSPIERRTKEKEEREKAYKAMERSRLAFEGTGSESTADGAAGTEMYVPVTQGDTLNMYGELYFSEDIYMEVMGNFDERFFGFSIGFE